MSVRVQGQGLGSGHLKSGMNVKNDVGEISILPASSIICELFALSESAVALSI